MAPLIYFAAALAVLDAYAVTVFLRSVIVDLPHRRIQSCRGRDTCSKVPGPGSFGFELGNKNSLLRKEEVGILPLQWVFTWAEPAPIPTTTRSVLTPCLIDEKDPFTIKVLADGTMFAEARSTGQPVLARSLTNSADSV